MADDEVECDLTDLTDEQLHAEYAITNEARRKNARKAASHNR